MTQLTLIMKRYKHIIRLFEAYIYYRLEGIYMCFICLKMKYLDQIRAMLTVPFMQSKSAFASLTVLEPPLLFNLAQRKPFVVILLYIYGHNNQTISNTNLNHTLNHLLFLSNYDQNLVKVGLVKWKIVQSVTHSNYSLYGQYKGKFHK